MEEELKNLKEVRRPEIIQKIEQAKELGDISENAEYHDAKDQQGLTEARIAELEETLKQAIVENASGNKSSISLGATFVVRDPNGKEKEFTLVGYNEADPVAGRISNESPLGKAFMNKTPGESVEVEVPKGIMCYKVLKIK